MTTLDAVREQIDDIDREILRLLERRARWANMAADVKLASGRTIRDDEREAVVLERAESATGQHITPEGRRRIFEVIIRETRYMEMVRHPETPS